MNLFSSKKNPKEETLLISIFPTEVTLTLIYFLPGEKPNIAEHIKRTFLRGRESSPESYISTLLEAISHGASSIPKKISQRRVFFLLPGDLYFAEAILVDKKEEKAFNITPDVVKKMIANKLSSLPVPLVSDVNTENKGPWHTVENHIMSVFINGYPVANPYGKKCRSLSLSLFVARIPESLLRSLEMLTKNTLESESASYYANIVALSSALYHTGGFGSDFILFHLGETISELSLVQGGHLSDIEVSSSGINTFAEKISTGVSESRQMIENRLLSSLEMKDKDVIEGLVKHFDEEIVSKIENLKYTGTLPGAIIIIGRSPWALLCQKLIEGSVVLKKSPHNFTVKIVDVSVYDSLVNHSEKISMEERVPVILDLLFILNTQGV